MLKPMLARGELHTIGATTLDEYRKYIEKDAALERRFQPVLVGEPTVEDTISILRGLRERYEIHHGVKFKDAALVAAAVLSHRYISDRFLPDKAIDLVDEAASKLRMEIDSMPAELDEVERRDHAARDRARGAAQGEGQGVEGAARQAREGAGRPEGRARRGWRRTGSRRRKRSSSVAQAEGRARERCGWRSSARSAPATTPRRPSCSTAACRSSNSRSSDEEARLAELQKGQRMLKEEVDEEDIAEVVSKWTHIPVSRLMEGEVQKLHPHGRAAAPARHRPGRGDQRRRERHPPRARRPAGSEPAARQLHLPRARPASARPSWRARSPSSCSTTSRRWSGSTCPSTRRSTRCRG